LRISELDDEKNNITWTIQKEMALLQEKIKYLERQKEDHKK